MIPETVLSEGFEFCNTNIHSLLFSVSESYSLGQKAVLRFRSIKGFLID